MAGAAGGMAGAGGGGAAAGGAPNAELRDEYMDDLRARAAGVRLLQIAPSTRKQYEGNSVKLLQWLFQHQRDVLTAEFIAGVVDPAVGPTKDYTLPWVQAPIADVSKTPIKFDVFTHHHFLPYVTWRAGPGAGATAGVQDITGIGYSALNMHRSALGNLYRDYHLTMSPTMSSEISQHFMGAKRAEAQKKKQGEGRVQVGMDPMDYSFYKWLCMALLVGDGAKSVADIVIVAGT